MSDDWSGPICNAEPLRPENDALFRSLWPWLAERMGSMKGPPQVTSITGERLSYHLEGVIGIDESQWDSTFPLGAVMLEELLHYATASADEQTSADFSPAYLHRILDLVVGELQDRADKRAFQNVLIGELWRAYRRSVQRIDGPETPS